MNILDGYHTPLVRTYIVLVQFFNSIILNFSNNILPNITVMSEDLKYR